MIFAVIELLKTIIDNIILNMEMAFYFIEKLVELIFDLKEEINNMYLAGNPQIDLNTPI